MGRALPYHGYYTASEYAIVKGRMLGRHSEKLSTSTIDTVVRYVAKHQWPLEREKCYIAAAQFEETSRAATYDMLRLYDEAQQLFDKVHYGDDYIRSYPEIPGIHEATSEFAPVALGVSQASSR